jgi:hypothetical protein
MNHTHYDPDIAPDAGEWLALPEEKRMYFVRSYHISSRIKVPNIEVHTALHVVVENQVASDYEPTKRAMARLQAQGLSRHDAIHAAASVIVNFISELHGEQSATERRTYHSRMAAAVERLDAKSWLSGSPHDSKN